jgi:hypothetical protein
VGGCVFFCTLSCEGDIAVVLDFLENYLHVALDNIFSIGFRGVILILLGAFLKNLSVIIWNIFSTKKIAQEIQRNYKIKSIIQRAENSRTLLNANRVLVTQLHNGDQWLSKKHMYKLSLFQELSVEEPNGLYRTKIFDKQLSNVLISNLAPLLENVTGKKTYDIVSVAELEKDFIFYKHLRLDKIKYLVLVKIQHKGQLLGYLILVFCEDREPYRDKEIFNNLVLLGEQIGEILK